MILTPTMRQGKDVAKFSQTSKRNYDIISKNEMLWESLVRQGKCLVYRSAL